MKTIVYKKVSIIAVAFVLFVTFPMTSFAREFTVTPGVEFSEGPTSWKNRSQNINHLTVDVNNPLVSVEAIMPNSLNTVVKTSQANSFDGHQVVGAINASFFHFDNAEAAYLLADNNIVNTYGVISSGTNEYMSVPSAFAIDQNNKGKIGVFGYDATFKINNVTQSITSINKGRGANEIVLYTPSFSYPTTRANHIGMEIVVSGLSKSLEENYELGSSVTATVEKVLPYGGGDSTIPEDGAVISIQGGTLSGKFKDVKPGMQVELAINLTEPWKNANFVLASGPLLVQNGKVDMTINPMSARATTRNPRSAVATNEDGSKIFLVTVDGRSGYSEGMTLTEFSEYLVSIGAHSALNLDGGGSTTMAVRERGYRYPILFNNPSGGSERRVSSILGAVSYAKTDVARTIQASISGPSVLLKGATTNVKTSYVLDQYFHLISPDASKWKYSVEGGIGTVDANGVFSASAAGKGAIVVSYDNAITRLPIEVLNEPASIEVSGPTGQEVGPDTQILFSLKAYDSTKREMVVPSNLVSWKASPELGSISSNGVLTTASSGGGSVTATIGSKAVSRTYTILQGGRVVQSFENANDWKSESARSSTSLRFDGRVAPLKDGQTALTLSYDFSSYIEGTSASYAVMSSPQTINPRPTHLGLWVYGDSASHWLRGTILDENGVEKTIDFTMENGLNWTGWRYVKATIPASFGSSIRLKKIYVAEPQASKKNKGSIYLDRLIAEYGNSYKEAPFNDVPLNYWGINEITSAVDHKWINGYMDGTFKPEQTLSRSHAALLLSRSLKLPTPVVSEAPFTDVPLTHPYVNEIAAIKNSKIMNGKTATTFDSNGNLSRAQMAAILVRSYDLEATSAPEVKDVPDGFWAKEEITILASKGITTIVNGYYYPNNSVTRSQFAAFLVRTEEKK
jgi:hypothetical protein